MLYPTFKIDKPIRLITLFSGYDSQALALKYLGVKFEHYKTCEWAVKSIQALKYLHFGDDNTDYSKDLSDDEVKDYLLKKGISSNYNEPMSKEQINRLKNFRQIYNNIQATQTTDLRIRKLTPKECFRLMGVKDEDFDNVAKNQSDSSLYHLAGDSIVVNVLMAIFKEMLCEY